MNTGWWSQTGKAHTPGRSLTDIFNSDQSGIVNPARDHVLLGQERHDVGRPHDWGYPIRSLIKDGWVNETDFEKTPLD